VRLYARVGLFPLDIWMSRYETDLVGTGPDYLDVTVDDEEIMKQVQITVLCLTSEAVRLDPESHLDVLTGAVRALVDVISAWNEESGPGSPDLLPRIDDFKKAVSKLFEGPLKKRKRTQRIAMALESVGLPASLVKEGNKS